MTSVNRSMARETLGCKSCTVEQRIPGSTHRLQTQVMAVSGKTLPKTETLPSKQRDREMRMVRFDVELLAEGGSHWKASMSSHVGRSHWPTSRISNRTDQEDIRASTGNREVRGQNSDGRCQLKSWRPIFSVTWSGIENTPENETRGDGTVLPKNAIHHHISDVEFESPTPQWTGRVPALSGVDAWRPSTLETPEPHHRDVTREIGLQEVTQGSCGSSICPRWLTC